MAEVSRLLGWLPDGRAGELAGHCACRLGVHSLWCWGWAGCAHNVHAHRQLRHRATLNPADQGPPTPVHPVFRVPARDAQAAIRLIADQVEADLRARHRLRDELRPRRQIRLVPSIMAATAIVAAALALVAAVIWAYT